MISHILLIFKYYFLKTRGNGSLDLKVLKSNIHKIENIGKQISLKKTEKWTTFEQKWETFLKNT